MFSAAMHDMYFNGVIFGMDINVNISYVSKNKQFTRKCDKRNAFTFMKKKENMFLSLTFYDNLFNFKFIFHAIRSRLSNRSCVITSSSLLRLLRLIIYIHL